MALLVLCAAMLLMPAAACAGVALEADIGYDGVITYVRTLPVHVRITNSDADMSGVVTVDVNRNEQEYDRYELPLSVASGSTLEASLPVVLTQMQKSYTVRWVVDGETVVQREIEPGGTIDPSSLIVGALGGNQADFSSFSITRAADPLLREEYWTVVPLDAASFPSDEESLRFLTCWRWTALMWTRSRSGSRRRGRMAQGWRRGNRGRRRQGGGEFRLF